MWSEEGTEADSGAGIKIEFHSDQEKRALGRSFIRKDALIQEKKQIIARIRALDVDQRKWEQEMHKEMKEQDNIFYRFQDNVKANETEVSGFQKKKAKLEKRMEKQQQTLNCCHMFDRK